MSPTRKTIENARILFRNFTGREGKYNREGDRNFAVVLEDPKLVKQMEKEGWNVKYLDPRDDDETPTAYVSVSVAYGNRPPKVVLISSRRGETVRTDLTEDMVETLDWIEIESCDMILNPYEWTHSGNSGVKAYLKSLFVTMSQDELDLKYQDVPYAGELEAGGDIIEGEIVEDTLELEA